DVFKDTDTIPKATDLQASDVDGASNYEQLTLVNNSKDETVADTTNNTNATLTSEITGNEDGAVVTYTITLDTAPTQKETFTFKVGDVTKTIEVEAGKTTGTTTVEFKESDVFKDTDTIPKATDLQASDVDGASNYEQLTLVNNSKDETVADSITAIVSTPKIIDVNTKLDGTTGVKITGINSDGEEVDLSIISGTDHDGFGVDGNNLSNGDTKELGVGEKIVVEFTNGKDVNSLDVSFAWRNNHETAKLTFVKNGQVVGYATVDGDGSSTTKAIVKYYDENNNLIKTQEAEGSSDRVDKAFTFELPDSNGGIVSFDKVEFSAPQNKDDYLINKIVYKEVLNPEVTDVVTKGGDITFNIQVDENYPPQGTAKATVEVNGKEYSVELNSTGRGTLTIDSKELGDLSNIIAKVTEVKGGNYEKVNPTEASFNFTPTLKSTDDKISTDEDVSYTIKVTDFGEVSSNTKEFKITELPTPEIGKLFLTIKTGDTIFNSDGTKTVATEDIKVEITKDQIVTLGQVGAGKVEFVPKENSDVDGSFKFQVGDGNGKFSEEYTTTIDIKAVADAPTVSIDITKIGATIIVVDGNGNSTSDTNSSNENGSSSIDMPNNWWNGLTELTKDNVINNNSTHNIESIDWSNRPSFTDGNDIVNIGTLTSSSNGINTGEGDDRIYISENIENNGSNINSGDGNDTVLLAKDVNSNVDLGVGNDRLDIKGNLGSTINAGSGDDKIFIKGSASQNSTINLGEGNNELHVKGDVGIVNGGSVADTVLVEGSTTNTINLGDGNNELHIKQNSGNTVTTGSGNDKIFIEGNSENTVTTGSGNDRVIIAGNTGNVIDLGSGNDYLEINGKVANSLNGGEGIDSLYLKSYTKADYDNNVDNLKWKIIDFENIKLGDGTIVKGDGSVFETSKPENIIKAVEYKVDISVSLTDTDRSETLSVVIKNVPADAILESTKYDVSKNPDGSWSVNFKAGTTGDALLKIEDSLTMKVPESYKGEVKLQIEAKATETRDNEDGLNFKTSAANDSVVMTTDETSVLTVSNEATNIVLTLDVTTSMVYNDYIDGNHTSLHVLQKSAISTIEAYSSKGETNVNMTIFSKTAHNLGWMTSSEAIDYLNKLTQDENGNELRHWELNEKLETKLGITDVSTTNYKNAIAETVKVDFSGKSGNNVGYFISDGRPWDDASDTTREYYSIGKDYQDQASWKKWESFIQNNKIDFKAIGIGMPEDNKKAESFLQDIQAVVGHKDIILIDEPTSMETIFLSTVDGTVSGDVSDNIFGGDGKVTIDSIVVGDTTYNKADYPYGLSTDKLGGKLTFDFETGKYAYNGNGENITTDISKSFQVNVSDENGDKGSLDVNFELKAQPITDGLVKFEKGGDINLSNLENIVNLKEINLDNGKENKLSLTLDDVLKLSGDDGKIKITGDEFYSVAFKNTTGENGQEQTWSKTAGEGEDAGFDIYVNSGDPTLQVKVEQPISDGITN
ncbi:MAG: hypothetical protein PHZ10_05685, partial [Aliarcobacter cryaerophilus]|nr:hypothetical protein [Aliarcobacter cryaerophilus]